MRATYITILILIVLTSIFFIVEKKGDIKTYNCAWEELNVDIKEKHDKKIKVAILDSGIKNKRIVNQYVVKKYDSIKDINVINTTSNHGSQIASIIAFSSHEEKIIGVNKSVEIYDVKVLDDNLNGNVNDIINGIKWSIKNDVDIINMSFGFQSYDKELQKIIHEAKQKGIILVGAAGNGADEYSDYPARFSDVISVTAIDEKGKTFLYAPLKKINFKAPGVSVLTLDSSDTKKIETGTSFSAAYFTSYIISRMSGNHSLEHVLANYSIK